MFSDKNQIIDPIAEYERYIINQMDGSIRIKYATFRESESASFTIEVNDDRTDDLSVVSEVMYYSDEFLEQNPDYILNSDYIISIGFSTMQKGNRSPSEPICEITNVNGDDEVTDHFCSVRISDRYIDDGIQRFDNMLCVNCYNFDDDQIERVLSSWGNLECIYITQDQNIDLFRAEYPEIEFITL